MTPAPKSKKSLESALPAGHVRIVYTGPNGGTPFGYARSGDAFVVTAEQATIAFASRRFVLAPDAQDLPIAQESTDQTDDPDSVPAEGVSD